MNEAPPAHASEEPLQPASKRSLWFGVAVGAACYLALIFMPPLFRVIEVNGHREMRNSPATLVAMFDLFALPIVAGILAALPATRRFGLGLLLVCGLVWLMLGATCGGAYLFSLNR